MTEKGPGFFNQLKARFVVIKQETVLEKDIIGGAADLISNKIKADREESESRWKSSGTNFWERVRSSARLVVQGLKDGWNMIREDVNERVNGLKTRYQEQGIWGAPVGVVADAVHIVQELPDLIGEKLNLGRTLIEKTKGVVIASKQEKLQTEQKEGWENEFAQWDLTKKHVKERKDLFEKRLAECRSRLDKMRQGRSKLREPIRVQPAVVVSLPPEAE